MKPEIVELAFSIFSILPMQPLSLWDLIIVDALPATIWVCLVTHLVLENSSRFRLGPDGKITSRKKSPYTEPYRTEYIRKFVQQIAIFFILCLDLFLHLHLNSNLLSFVSKRKLTKCVSETRQARLRTSSTMAYLSNTTKHTLKSPPKPPFIGWTCWTIQQLIRNLLPLPPLVSHIALSKLVVLCLRKLDTTTKEYLPQTI